MLLILFSHSSLAGSAIPLYKVIDDRLELMHSVAAYKWINNQKIEDKSREKVIIEKARQSALKQGLTPDSVETFFTAQIEAAKEVQLYWFTQWQQGNAPTRAADLGTKVRPQLLFLGMQITEALSSGQPIISGSAFKKLIAVEGLTAETKQQLYSSLKNIKQFSNRLQQVVQTGELRIGTTGDYAPFSIWNDDSPQPSGIDIELGRNLAHSLGVSPVFVKTSWPTLMQDLTAGNYDIAMSGVSITHSRKNWGAFSTPYHIGGKTPIALCENKNKFGSLSVIDQQSVRVIVNPGGTNERFLDANIHSAKKIVHMDNRTIFQQLIESKADVMITDRIEVEFQTNLHLELCSTMTENLNSQKKSFFMPKDQSLIQAVNLWLKKQQSSGFLQLLFKKNLTQLSN